MDKAVGLEGLVPEVDELQSHRIGSHRSGGFIALGMGLLHGISRGIARI